jgi:hypothetical protein
MLDLSAIATVDRGDGSQCVQFHAAKLS